ncbi:MAG: hypothetical protein U1E65_30525 [Myxococcota bacterium]
MSSTYAETVRALLLARDNATLVPLLEQRVKEGSATESEHLLCGALLLMPPFVDDEAARAVFGGVQGPRRFEAAVWDAYRFAVLTPEHDEGFMDTLRAHRSSAVAAYMLSKVADMVGDLPRAREERHRSLRLRPIPFDVIQVLRRDPLEPDQKLELWRTLQDLMLSVNVELEPPATTIEGSLQRLWDNLIVGTRVTSVLWEHYASAFRSLGP